MSLKKSYAENTRSSVVRFITGENQGRPAWWYVEVQKLKWPLYEQAIKKAQGIKLTQYGVVLRSGWGELPPKPIQEEMEKLFNVKIAE